MVSFAGKYAGEASMLRRSVLLCPSRHQCFQSVAPALLRKGPVISIVPSRRTFSTEVSFRSMKDGKSEIAHVFFSGRKKYAFVNEESLTSLGGVFKDLWKVKSATLRAVFLRSTFPGADIEEMAALKDHRAAMEFIGGVGELCNQIYEFPVPVVAVVDGPCLGAGMEIVASCDLRIAVKESATFGMPETILGIPSIAQASLIPGIVGWGRARELLYFGEAIDADKAHDWGFINALTNKDDLERIVQAYEDKIDATDNVALQRQKHVLRHWQQHDAGVLGNSEFTDKQFADLIQTGRPSQLMNQFIRARAAKK